MYCDAYRKAAQNTDKVWNEHLISCILRTKFPSGCNDMLDSAGSCYHHHPSLLPSPSHFYEIHGSHFQRFDSPAFLVTNFFSCAKKTFTNCGVTQRRTSHFPYKASLVFLHFNALQQTKLERLML